MELSKEYLETVCTSELLNLAELYGIYIPKDLKREFIIGEFLEYANESKFYAKAAMLEIEEPADTEEVLPKTFEVTNIHVLLKDPMWVFVFWDFNSQFFENAISEPDFDSFLLRVVLMSKDNTTQTADFYDIDISINDRKRYVHLSFNDEVCRVDLCIRTIQKEVKVLSQSNTIDLKRHNIQNRLCVSQDSASEIEKLSGLKLIKSSHFKNFRQAFRNES
ncbi:MAG: DUF4912 domain-containing protein [Treponema sp.]|nr:MAG: DUF4912 domain-containing protein [Treponema sp.]